MGSGVSNFDSMPEMHPNAVKSVQQVRRKTKGSTGMQRFAASCVVFLAVFLSLPLVAQAQSGDDPFGGPNALILRGDAHYWEGDYYRALSSYKDFLYSYPDDPRGPAIRLKKAWIYQLAGEQRASAYQLHLLSQERSQYPEGWWARYYMGQVALDAERTPMARRAFEEILVLCDPQVERFRSGEVDEASAHCVELTGRARLALADLSAMRHDFDSAVGHLYLIPPESPLAGEAAEIATVVEGIKIPQKSPGLAGALSIIPGLGHIYIGEYSNALMAAVWNGIFIYGLVDSILSGRYGQAAVIGLLESIWYGGTIFGAVAGAHRYNRDAFRIVESGLRRDIDSLIEPEPWTTGFPARAPAYLELSIEF